MVKPFIETLMDHIMEAVMIPKSQVERAVGPILSMFLESVLTETFREDPELSGEIALICPEFPLKKTDNWQSTNIDWLLYNSTRKQLLFVELKTSDTSLKDDQNNFYHLEQQAVRNKGGAFLIEDLELIGYRSNESGKYHYILEKKVLPFASEIANCFDARIIYLVPGSAKHKVEDHADLVLTFGMLPESIPGPFAEEWRIIHKHLCMLDDSSQRSRNLRHAKKSSKKGAVPGQYLNWQGYVKFPEMVRLCEANGNNIIIGFTGGVTAFSSRTLDQLRSRLSYKWDYATNTARKTLTDWLPGGTIIELLKRYHGYPKI